MEALRYDPAPIISRSTVVHNRTVGHLQHRSTTLGASDIESASRGCVPTDGRVDQSAIYNGLGRNEQIKPAAPTRTTVTIDSATGHTDEAIRRNSTAGIVGSVPANRAIDDRQLPKAVNTAARALRGGVGDYAIRQGQDAVV